MTGVGSFSSNADKIGMKFQRRFMKDAIAHFGGNVILARQLCLTYQTIDNWTRGDSHMPFVKMLRVAELMGLKEIKIAWD